MTLVVHNPPTSTATSPLYTVTVNGIAAREYYTSLGSFVNFSTDETVLVSVTFSTTVTTAVLTPQRKNIPVTINGAVVTFTLSGTDLNGQYVLRINDPNQSDDAQTPTWEPLFIFANPLEISPPSADGTDLKFIGAGDWVVTSSTTIVPWTGAETVSDNYYDIAQNKSVYIHGGAVVRGKFKFGSDSNVGAGITLGKLYGRGIVDASFTPAFGRIVRINHSSNITLDGFIGIGQVQWGVAFRQSNTCTANNVKVINSRRWNGSIMTGTPDGIDVTGSNNVTVQNSFVRSYDDAITVKSDMAGGGWAADTFNITYQNMVIYQGWGGNAMEIGYEVPNPISNITFKNIDIVAKRSRDVAIDTRDALSIYVNDVADVSGVTYENIHVENVDANSNYIGIVSNNATASITGITYKNIVFYGQPAERKMYIKGIGASGNISGVTFQDIRFGGPGGKAVSAMSEMQIYPATSDGTNFRAYSVVRTSHTTTIGTTAFGVLNININKNIENILSFRYLGTKNGVNPRFSVASTNGSYSQIGSAVFNGNDILVTINSAETVSDMNYYRLELVTQTDVADTIYVGYVTLKDSPISSYSLGSFASITVDPSLGGVQYGTLTGNGTIQISTTSAKYGDKLVLKLTQDATGSRVPTWGSNVKLATNLLLSTGANKIDVLSFIFDGTYWRELYRSLNQS